LNVILCSLGTKFKLFAVNRALSSYPIGFLSEILDRRVEVPNRKTKEGNSKDRLLGRISSQSAVTNSKHVEGIQI
jgi:hypothetical protein